MAMCTAMSVDMVVLRRWWAKTSHSFPAHRPRAMHRFLLALLALLLLGSARAQMELSNCSFDIVPRSGAYYISADAFISQISVARFNMSCDLVVNYTVTGRFNRQPKGQPSFSVATTVTFLGRWDTITEADNCSCSCSGTMMLAPALGANNCTDFNAVRRPDDYNFCADLAGIQDYFLGTYYWAMDSGNLLISRTGIMAGRAATFTTSGELMPYTSFPGTYWGYTAAYVVQNCASTPAPPPPTPPPIMLGSCCDARCYAFTNGFNNYTTACQLLEQSACLALGPSYAWGGAGTTCFDGSCAGSCCCNNTGVACVPYPTGISPYACSQTCNFGQWGGAANNIPCTGTCQECLSAASQFPLIVPDPPIDFAIPDPPSAPLGLCYWGGCIAFPVTPGYQACFDYINASDCYSLHPGYLWGPDGINGCYSAYIRPYCSNAIDGSGSQVCGNSYNFGSAAALALAYPSDNNFWYGNLPNTDIGCAVPPYPTPIACPVCPGYVPPTPPPPPPPPPSPVYTLFNVTGACCSQTCRLTDADDNGCYTVTRTACDSLGPNFVYKSDYSSCNDGISCTGGCCNNQTAGQCSDYKTWDACVTQAENLGVVGVWFGGGNPGPFSSCDSGGYCTPPSPTCVIPVPPPPTPTPPPPPAVRTGACVKTGPSAATDLICADVAKENCEQYENPFGDFAFLKRETSCAANTWGACCCGSTGTSGPIGFCGTTSATNCATQCNGASPLSTGFWYGQGSSINCQTALSSGCPPAFSTPSTPSDACDWICFLPFVCNGFGQCG